MKADKYLSKNVYDGIRIPSKKDADTVRKFLKQWRRKICKHVWVEKDFKRTCSKCNKHEHLFEKRYPDVGEAKYQWEDMTIDI